MELHATQLADEAPQLLERLRSQGYQPVHRTRRAGERAAGDVGATAQAEFGACSQEGRSGRVGVAQLRDELLALSKVGFKRQSEQSDKLELGIRKVSKPGVEGIREFRRQRRAVAPTCRPLRFAWLPTLSAPDEKTSIGGVAIDRIC
mgnify:CR=1 FL=1